MTLRTTILAPLVVGLAAIALQIMPFTAASARAGTLENLERERALLVAAFLDPAPVPQERWARMAQSRRRLLDLERLVLRDDSLLGRNTPAVRRAFENYDLTFLVHAAAERDLPPVELWLGELGISTDTAMAARAGWR